MTHIDKLIAAVKSIQKEISAVEKAQMNVTNNRDYDKTQAEREALYRKLGFAAEDLARAALLVSREI